MNNITSALAASSFGGSNYFQEARKFGIFGDATLGFRNYAFLHGAYRTDIDSRLSSTNRFIPYYSVDGTLVLSDMLPSITNNKILSFAKVRGAYSVTGNASALGGGSSFIASGAYTINPTFSVASGFPFSGVGGYSLNTTIANPNLRPEKVTETEGGIELGFLKNRFTLGVTVYHQELTDGIVTANVSPASGSLAALLNAAHTTNDGIEADLKATVIQTKSVTWNVSVNYTHIKSNVVSINGALNSLSLGNNIYDVVGNPFPLLKVTDWNRDPATGKVIVDAVTGNPSVNPTAAAAGQTTPTDLLGFTTSVTWKSLTFTATADYRGGNNAYYTMGNYIDFTGISQTSAATGRQRFVFPNSVYMSGGKYVNNTNVTVDDANFNFWPGLYRSPGHNYVASAAFWKLREVSISYNIPRKIFAATKIIQNATFTVSGRNLLMLRPKTNLWTDPEFNDSTGNAVGTSSINEAPPTRIFSATLAVTF